MASPRASDVRDPRLIEALRRHEGAWVLGFLARAAHGLASVVVVSAAPEGTGSVALLSPTEASALLRKAGDTRGSARVAGTPSPGSTWCIGLLDGAHAVWSLAMTPILARGGG
jgi:hypothetical protein